MQKRFCKYLCSDSRYIDQTWHEAWYWWHTSYLRCFPYHNTLKIKSTRWHAQVIAPQCCNTVLELTQEFCFHRGPSEAHFTTLDLDLYSAALQIQQSVSDHNCIMRVGVLHILCCTTHSWKDYRQKWHWYVCHWKWNLHLCNSLWDI